MDENWNILWNLCILDQNGKLILIRRVLKLDFIEMGFIYSWSI